MPVNLNPIQGLANRALNSAAGSVSNALGSLGSSAVGGVVNQLVSSLPNIGTTGGAIPPSLGISLTDPVVDRVKSDLQSLGILIFPQDLPESKAYFKFDIKQAFRPSPVTPIIYQPLITIGLPVPTNLTEQFQMKYNEIAIGALLGNDKVKNAALQVSSALMSEGKGVDKSALTSSVKSATEEVVKGVVPLAIRGMAKTLDAGLGAIVDQIKGGVPNPNLALLYEGHGFRTFNFTWKLLPRNASESATLQSIVNTIKHSMHPTRNGLFLDFPYLAEPYIKIGGQDLFIMKRCAITSFNVNFAPSGTPAFFSQTSQPVEVDISMTLQETEIFTSADFKPSAAVDKNKLAKADGFRFLGSEGE